MSDPGPVADKPQEPACASAPAQQPQSQPQQAPTASVDPAAVKELKIPLATASAPASPAANQARQTSSASSSSKDNKEKQSSSSNSNSPAAATVPKPPAPAETRLNANAKSFTPAGPPKPPPPTAGPETVPPSDVPPPPPPPQQQQQPPHPHAPGKQPSKKKKNNNSHPPAGPKDVPQQIPPATAAAYKSAPPAAAAVPVAPGVNPNAKAMLPMPHYPQMQPGKQPMMNPTGVPFLGTVPPGVMTAMGGHTPGYLMPQGFMPPPPGMQMPPHFMYGQPGTVPVGSVSGTPPQPQQPHSGMMPMWMPPPQQQRGQYPHPPQHPQQYPGGMPMPMVMPHTPMQPAPAHPPTMSPGQKSTPGVVPSLMAPNPGQNRAPSQSQTTLQHPHPMHHGAMMAGPGVSQPGMMSYFQPPPGMMAAPPMPGMPPGMMAVPPAMMPPPPNMHAPHPHSHPHPQQQQQQPGRPNTMNASVTKPQQQQPMPLTNAGNSMAGPGMIIPPPQPTAVAAQGRISVGNATLAALSSKEPPKFSCVLLSGIPAVGKTTLGRELVNSLKTDGMGWAFFSGADFLVEQQGKRSVWETTREVFDALSTRLDELLEQQRKHRNIKGLVIDKNCKGIEDVYYLNALLRSKNIPFVGIVGMECSDDDVLVKRMGGDDYLKEKLKFHRVIHARIVSLAKSAGMYRYVDATKSKEEVVQQLRTMVLGCCAQPPNRSIAGHQYEDSRANVMVEDYKEYSDVLTHLFKCVNNRGSQFPGSTDLVPFSTKEMSDKNRINALKSRYGIRRKVDGNRYLLVYYQKKLYLVPPHMRAVLLMPLKAWLGTRLDSEKVGTFVLEGDLARLCHDRQKEMFLVYDAHYWSEAESPSSNTMIRMTFSERQSFLAGNMCNEEKAFTSSSQEHECVVVHQPTQKMAATLDMLDSDVYPSDGLVFQAVNPIHRSDHVFVWQQPSCLTVDFRVGRLLDTKMPVDLDSADNTSRAFSSSQTVAAAASATTTPAAAAAGARRGSTDAFLDHPVRTFALEVYDKTEKMYVQYEKATVDVRHPDVVEGCIVTCSLVDDVPRRWMFRRLRYDVLRPIYKMDLEELLSSCLIPRAKLVSWLLSEQLVPLEIQSENHRSASGTGGIPSVPPPSYDAAAAAVIAMNASAAAGVSMGALAGGTVTPFSPPPMTAVPTAPTVAVAPAAAVVPVPVNAVTATAPVTRSLYPSASAMLSRVAAVVPAKPVVATPPAHVPMSTEQQLKQLASIVPSLHVVDHSKDSKPAAAVSATAAQAAAAAASTPSVNAGTPSAPAAAAASMNANDNHSAAVSSVSAITSDGKAPVAARVAAAAAAAAAAVQNGRSCAQCHKTRQSEDLRMDRRDHKYYCYSCWSKLGFGFCVVCGEFKEVRREVRGRQKGSTICGACGKAAAVSTAASANSSAALPAPADAAAAPAAAQATPANNNKDAAASAPTAAAVAEVPAAGAKPPLTDEQKIEAEAARKARRKAALKEKKAAAAAAAAATAGAATVDATAVAVNASQQDSGSAIAGNSPNSPDSAKSKKKKNRKKTASEDAAVVDDCEGEKVEDGTKDNRDESTDSNKNGEGEKDSSNTPEATTTAASESKPIAEVENPEKKGGGGCRQQ